MKYLAVDLGNVIVSVDFKEFLDQLSDSLNISMDDVNYFLNRTQKLHDLGLTNIADELRDHFKIKSKVTIDRLITLWNRTVKTDPTMVKFLCDLINLKNGEPTKLALLSNIGLEHAELMPIILTPNVFGNSIKFFSCEVGARKPSYLYYKLFLDMNPEFKGCVYLDDRPENVAIGNLFGFKSIEFALDSFKTDQALLSKLDEIKKLM